MASFLYLFPQKVDRSQIKSWFNGSGRLATTDHRCHEFQYSSLQLSEVPLQGRIQGGSWGADDPPFGLEMMASFKKIEPFSLAKLQLFQTFSSYCCIKHIKLTSKVQNLVEIEHFTVKKQLMASRSRQLGSVVNQFVGVSKNFARALRARIVV